MLLVDANDELVLLADFEKATVVQLGRKGSGPGEYRFPYRLLNLGGDSVGIEDAGNKRILVVTGTGKFSGVLNAVGMRVGSQVRGEAPKASDGLGRFYASGVSVFRAFDSLPASAPIERWHVGGLSRDTVAWLPLLPAEQMVTRPGEGSRAFVVEPEFAVALDGRIAIVHPNPYSVDLVDARGGKLVGKPIPYQRLRVSEEHKQRWREEQAKPAPVTIMTPKGDVSAGLRSHPIAEPIHWPTYLPPFLHRASQFAPDGMLWIQRTVPVGRPEVFDLVDHRGVVAEQVSAPARSRLVGFGRTSIYLVRLDEDDQEILERYKSARQKP